MRILTIEDDRHMAELLRKGLVEEGHSVALANTGPDGLALAEGGSYDVIVLDVMLPGIDGYEVARRLRRTHNRTPILMLTARDATADVVEGLDAGADDYLTKPFSFDEFLARVRAVARRGPIVQGIGLRVGDLTLDPATRDVIRAGEPLTLTRTEYSLLEFLMRRAGHVVARDALIDGVWGYEREIEDNTLDAFVRLLRQKVDGSGRPRLIHTVRGVGYCLREEPLA
ncbi:MAG: response regulator transcription factor [Acidobacteria bacterium]|jgi:two-component system response regulator MprA|nr:response regulator transcription factor [Acidobacteriota bacterium]